MSVRTSLRIGSVLLGLSLVVTACAGAGEAGSAGTGSSGSTLGSGNDGTSGAAASAEPTFDLGNLLSPDPAADGTPGASTPPSPSAPAVAQQPTQQPAGTPPAAISTTKASSLLSQVDHLLSEMNGELSNADTAANNPGE